MQKEEQETYGKKRYYNSISGKISIEERPKIVENRRRYGDWDADTIIGRQGGAVLVTLVERKSKLCLIGWSANKKSEPVKEVIIELLASFSAYVHTLTYDNGPEFAKHKEVDEALKKKDTLLILFALGKEGYITIVAFDKGYNDYGWYKSITDQKVSFRYKATD